MFRIIKDGASVGMTEAPNFIRQQENGCFALCPEPMASGIVFEGTVYHLLGRDALDGAESVVLEETDAGTEITKANATGGIMFVSLAEAGSIDDVTAAEHSELFAEWAYPISYKTGQLRRYGGSLYRCVQDHTSLEGWTPEAASSLWAHMTYITPGTRFPTMGSISGNVWEPGVYGWEEVTDGV